ncbi:MAG: PLP-dependent aminotransferase family protein [Vicinamibacteria bacterium]
MLVRLSDQAPLHLQIYRAFREAILAGEIPPGSRVPSSRAQARDLGVSRNVVLQAYSQLEAEGYIGGARGSGTYVSHAIPDSLAEPQKSEDGRVSTPSPLKLSPFARRTPGFIGPKRQRLPYDFAYGLARPDETTLRKWQRALRKAGEKLPLDYGPPEGEPLLRESIARYLFRNRAVRTTAGELVVTSGSQQALSLVSRILFEPGDAIVIEEPTYQGARQIFAADGLQLLPWPVGEEGLEADARAAYVTPSHQFPTGTTMPIGKRLKLLAWADERNAVVIEDDYDSEYRYEGRPLESIQGLDASGRVVYVGTFSKVMFPGLRIGYVALPRELVPSFVRAKWLADRQASLLEQRALAQFLQSGEFEQHLRRTRARNQRRREALFDALRTHLREPHEISGANAGIHLVAWFPERTERDIGDWIDSAREVGVGLYSVAPYYLSKPKLPGLLFGYGNLEEDEIAEGVRRFARLL